MKIDLGRQLQALAASVCLAMAFSVMSHADEKPASPQGENKPFDVKNMFRNVCGFCHEDYGRHGGKGPQLMNSERSDEYLFNRIKNGLPGRMAAFGSIYNDDQIRQMVVFIRRLKPDEEPRNP